MEDILPLCQEINVRQKNLSFVLGSLGEFKTRLYNEGAEELHVPALLVLYQMRLVTKKDAAESVDG